MSPTAITLRHITAMYADVPALWNVTADIPEQVLGAIVGPNGAGKTTLLKVMLGLHTPIAGSVNISRSSHSDNTLPIAYVPQRRSVDWDFPVTVLDVVMMGCYHRVGWFRQPPQHEYDRAYAVLKQVDVYDYADRPIGHLSGGQQQRVFLARALIQDAQLYVLDEPFVGIDKASEATIIQVLKQLRDAGKTLLVVHHDLHTVQAYFDWVMLLNVELIASGRLDHVYTQENLARTYETTYDMMAPYKDAV